MEEGTTTASVNYHNLANFSPESTLLSVQVSPSPHATPRRGRSSKTRWCAYHQSERMLPPSCCRGCTCMPAQTSAKDGTVKRVHAHANPPPATLNPELSKQVLEYLTHQRLLFPALATTYAMHLSTDRLKVRFATQPYKTTVHEEMTLCVFAMPSRRQTYAAAWTSCAAVAHALTLVRRGKP